MRLILKLLTFVYTIFFIGVFAALLLLCVAHSSLKPESLSESLGKIDYSQILISDFKNNKMNEKYGDKSTVEDMLVYELTDENLSTEDAIKIVNNDGFRNMFFESSYASLMRKEPKVYTDVEVKKVLSSLHIVGIDYKKAAEILNEKAGSVKIPKYANNVIYEEVVKKIEDVEIYTIIFIGVSYLLLAIFTLDLTRPMQLVGYPMTIIGTIAVCLSILLEMLLKKIMAPAYKALLVPLFKASLLKYGIIALVIGLIMAIIYEILNKRRVIYDKELYSYSLAPQVGNPAPQMATPGTMTPQMGMGAPASSGMPTAPVAPTQDGANMNNQIS